MAHLNLVFIGPIQIMPAHRTRVYQTQSHITDELSKIIMKIKAIALLFTLMSSTSFALQVSDANFSQTLSASDKHPELTLNGAALRELYLLVETYAGALYLEEPSQDASTVINSQQHKKMVFHVLMKRVSARRLSNALQEALVLNISKEQHNHLQPAIDKMLSFFEGSLRHGDQVEFNYSPEKGTEVIIGGISKGTITSKDYFDSMLKIWIGENPVTRSFKEQVLGLAGL